MPILQSSVCPRAAPGAGARNCRKPTSGSMLALSRYGKRRRMIESTHKKSEFLLKIKWLKKYYPFQRGLLGRAVGWVQAVDGVSLSIKNGETLWLVGESGCGSASQEPWRLTRSLWSVTCLGHAQPRRLRRVLDIVIWCL